MENISEFTSSITAMDESGGYVSKFKLTGLPKESVLYSNLIVNLLVDYIRDSDGIPHTKTVNLILRYSKNSSHFFIDNDSKSKFRKERIFA